MVQWLAISPHRKKVLGSIPWSGCLCVEFACSPCTCVLFSLGGPTSSQSPKTCQPGVSFNGHSKSPVGLNVSEGGCLSLYVVPAMATCPRCPRLPPEDVKIGSDLAAVENEWMHELH